MPCSHTCALLARWPQATNVSKLRRQMGQRRGNIFRQQQLLIHHKLYLSVCWSYDSFVQRLTQQVTTNFKKKLETGVRQP